MDMILDGEVVYTADKVCEMYSLLSCALDKAASYCSEECPDKARSWVKARADLEIMMKKRGLQNAEYIDREIRTHN